MKVLTLLVSFLTASSGLEGKLNSSSNTEERLDRSQSVYEFSEADESEGF